MSDWISCKYCGGSIRILFGDMETVAHEECEKAFKDKNFEYIKYEKTKNNNVKFFDNNHLPDKFILKKTWNRKYR